MDLKTFVQFDGGMASIGQDQHTPIGQQFKPLNMPKKKRRMIKTLLNGLKGGGYDAKTKN